MIAEFFAGIGFLARGFGYWRKRPGLMALGLVPAVISLLVLASALIPLFVFLGRITTWATPFADSWSPFWAGAVRSALGAMIVIAAVLLASVLFTALTLAIGDPFYQRIWRAVENDLGGEVPAEDGSRGVALSESVRLVVLGVLVALLAFVLALIPALGGMLAAVTGVLLTGRLLARELTARALNARDMPTFERSQLFGAHRWRLLGFGTATQLFFAIPLGAVFIMPTAVAGATLLSRDLLVRGIPPRGPAVPGPPPPGSQAPGTVPRA